MSFAHTAQLCTDNLIGLREFTMLFYKGQKVQIFSVYTDIAYKFDMYSINTDIRQHTGTLIVEF